MTSRHLQFLLTDEFGDAVGFIPPPAVLHRVLQRAPGVHAVRLALRHGEITEPLVREFVASLAAGYSPGRALPGDLALAALAVAMEYWPPSYAEEFLCHLASLNLVEM